MRELAVTKNLLVSKQQKIAERVEEREDIEIIDMGNGIVEEQPRAPGC